MSLIEALRGALIALVANPLRSALTALGIFIGVGAVIATVAVGAGARDMVLQRIGSLGSNLLVVIAGSVNVGGVRMGGGTRLSLSEDDAIAIEAELPAIEVAAPAFRGTAQVVHGNLNWSTSVVGVTPNFMEARDWPVFSGRWLTREDVDAAAQVALIGETVALNLFPEEDPVGRVIRIRNVPMTIVGVLARKGQNMIGQDQDDVVLLPLSTAKRRVIGVTPANARSVQTILVRVRDGEDMTQAEEDVRDLLRQRHRLLEGQEDDFWIRNLAEVIETVDQSARLLSLLLASIAGVSLVVGGIGIMNIMMVSVTERTREIGLRLAVGARRRDILGQFLIEATTLAIAGGAMGIVVGTIAAMAIAAYAGWPVLIQFDAIALAVGVSAMVGIFFGFYPARRAARLDPIEALRHE